MTHAASGFEALYRAEYAPLVRVAYALTGSGSEAEELVQEAFLRCHRHWSRVEHYERPGAWSQRPGGGSAVELAPSSDDRETTVPHRPVTTTTPPTTAANPSTPAPPAPPAARTCTADLVDVGRTYEFTVPEGWYASDLVESPDGSADGRIAACSRFGPEPLVFYDFETDWGWASNAVVNVTVSPSGPGTFEDLVAGNEADPAPVSAQRTQVDGRPAVRLERVDQLAGGRYVRWLVAVGDPGALDTHALYVTAGENDLVSYEESVAALDALVASLRVRAAP